MVGGTVSHQGHLIKIEGGIFTDQDGYLYNGSINVKVGYLDSTSRAQQRSMPGGYSGYLPDG